MLDARYVKKVTRSLHTACRLELALRGVFAGNIFDLGAEASAQQYAEGGSAFATTRDQVRMGCGCGRC